jgi:hypothetical protein
MKAYLNTCAIRQNGKRDSFQTVEVPVIEKPMPHHLAGLSWTATGYGARIPTRYMVQVNGKWRRVYAIQYSNAGTLFIGRKYDASAIVDVWQ